MQYKNIIFDLCNFLVKLNPEVCIHTFQNAKFDDWLSLRF